MAQKWEYADLFYEAGRGKTRRVKFTHREQWDKIPSGDLMSVLRTLGEDGWEMVTHSTTGEGWSGWYFKRPLEEP